MTKEKNGMGLVFVVFFLAIAGIIYAIIRYLKLWKCTGLSPVIYFIIEFVLTAIMLFSAFSLGKLNDSFLVPVLQFIGTLQFIILIYSAIFFILRDIIGLFSLIFKNSKGFRDKLYSPLFLAVLLISLVVLSIIGFVNMGIIRQKTCEINVAKKAAVDSMDFAVVADLHVGTGVQVSELSYMVEKINEMECDAVFIVGDIMDNNTPDCAFDAIKKELKNLKADKGVFFSYGNHDEAGGKLDEALKEAGIRILADEAIDIEGITVVGRKDGWNTNIKDMKEYNLDTNKPIIVLNHQPRDLKTIADAGADITFSGHTHGEQFPFAYFLNLPNNDNNYWTKSFGDMISFVTCGVGGWGFRFKFPSGCEVVKVTVNFN